MLAVEPAFLTRRMEWLCVTWRGYCSLVKERRERKENIQKKDEKKGENVNGGVIYVVGSNHSGGGFLPIIPYMDTYMRLE